MTGFGENGQNGRFGPKWAIFDSFCPGMAKTGFFLEKAKMSLPYAYYMLQHCAKSQNKPMNGF